MRKLALAVSLVAVACGPGDTAESTTTSSTGPATTTTAAPAATTTTASPATTSTAAPTTTTVLEPTTTTMLVGTWAEQPLVTTGFGALGWWDGSGWVDAATAGTLPVSGGEDYQVVVLDQQTRTTGSEETIVCAPLDLVGVELTDPELLGEFPGPYGVAISAPWALQPHLFEEAADDGTYAGFASELLASRGLDVPDPIIKQLFRADLEGDGVNEVLVVAEDVTPGFLLEEGDYSLAFVRKVVDGEVQTMVLGETIALDEADQFGGAFSFGTVADLNGDGKMEIVVNGAYFESFGVSVWDYVDDDLGAVEVLMMGCGS